MTTSRLEGKVALITGGTKGIGRAIAIRLCNDGARVVVNYSSDAAAAAALVDELGADRALAIKADVGTTAALEGLVQECVAHYGRIDIVIPNAGILLMRDLEHTTEEDFHRCVTVNIQHPYFLVQKALPHLSAGARVILLSTTLCTATTVTAEYLLYLTSKGAIDQMVRALSKDLARRQITVNAVAPGPTATELFKRGKSEQVLETLANLNPHRRLGMPEDIADSVAFLCSADSRWITGQTILVNGGMA